MLNSVSQIIDAFGGTFRFAEAFDLNPSSVSRARRVGRIPYRWQVRLLDEAQRRQIRIAPELLGLEQQ